MPIKITYFVHGTTTDNEQDLATGHAPGELSELGKQQANGDGLEKELTFTRFDQMCESYPLNTAVVYLGDSYSYRRVQDLSLRFAGALREMGVKKGDRVMIYISNCIQWIRIALI